MRSLFDTHAPGGQEELAAAVRGEFSADGCPPGVDDPPAHRATGVDRAIRLSTAAAVLAVAGIAAFVSYWHAYAVVRAHGEAGITARLEPATIDGLVYASSMVVLYAAPGTGCRSPPSEHPGPGLRRRTRAFRRVCLTRGCPLGSGGATWPGRSSCAQIQCRLVVKGFRTPASVGLHQGVDEIGSLEIRHLQVLQPGPVPGLPWCR